jgi:hypothetical protein
MTGKMKVVTVVSSAALLLTLVSLPVSSQDSSDQVERPEAEDVTRFTYSGSNLEGIRKVSQDAPQTTTSLAYINLSGASTSWFVPVFDSDLLNVGFSGECRLFSATLSNANQDWVEIRAALSRVPALIGFPTFMEPYSPPPIDPMAFCSANGYAMHHANWARRVTGGTTGATYTVQIQYRVVNNPPVANPAGTLRAWLDDWKLELAAYN